MYLIHCVYLAVSVESDITISLTQPSFIVSKGAMKYVYAELLNCLN